MTKLMQVKGNGCALLWPATFPEDDNYRGGTGFVIDADAPGEDEFCAGQMHKLEPAPKGAVADKVDHPIAIRRIREVERERAKQAAEPEVVSGGKGSGKGAAVGSGKG